MPATKRCSFCDERVTPGRGIMYVKRDGRIQYYCSSKCRRNAELGRKPHKVKWTKRSREARGKE
ncbi:50S ribosomal protein L24 [candidate division MSBL1 archaeon SCGC-AAA261G05]|uniref:Large ribosomal subunit protein eL24 n=3 Tax=candidate division MSBL1 TaxID=215777 RepID=A0A133V2B1_9EURY|nr:50S ribosomal protein L24 [candidate division MSBL1 archaeon SCGC-AAA261C02]KXB04028.1 50S ribosomal protein L24 [candidate division MSBL1 archaeon SCGC-AAA261G05]KXB04693.1 50S ribosomal protein L24 [candidate division MSBL1 archaeon SCGC-AAA261O19]